MFDTAFILHSNLVLDFQSLFLERLQTRLFRNLGNARLGVSSSKGDLASGTVTSVASKKNKEMRNDDDDDDGDDDDDDVTLDMMMCRNTNSENYFSSHSDSLVARVLDLDSELLAGSLKRRSSLEILLLVSVSQDRHVQR